METKKKEILNDLNFEKKDFPKKKIIIKNKDSRNIKKEENDNLEREKNGESPDSKEKEIKFKLRTSSINFNNKNKLSFHKQNTFLEPKKYKEEKTRNILNNNFNSHNTKFIYSENENNNKIINKINNNEQILNLPIINTQGNNKVNNSNNGIKNISSFKKAITLNEKKVLIKENANKRNNSIANNLSGNTFLKEENLENKITNLIPTNTNFDNENQKIKSKKKLFLKIKTYTKENNIIKELISDLKISDKNLTFPKYPSVKYSHRSINHYIKSFAVNSYQGLIRDYNEDKVSIILTIKKPKNYIGDNWPKISYLAIFDGHGGNLCSNFLRDNLHNYIIKSENFLENVEKSLRDSFEKAENDFINNISQNDKSGSCALVSLIIDNNLYIANCGDSRAVISLNSGKEIQLLNNIHRPNNINEKNRIINNGGSIYISNNILRIYPGRLSVTRAFGDKNAKLTEFGGKENCLICTPEIFKVNLKGNKVDFLIMGCDGIFEYLTNEDCVNLAWKVINEEKRNYNNFHQMNGDIVDLIIKSALKRNSSDNVTCLFVSFRSFEKKFYEGSFVSSKIHFKNFHFENNLSNNKDNENEENINEEKNIKDNKNIMEHFNNKIIITKGDEKDIIENKKKPIITFNPLNTNKNPIKLKIETSPVETN